MEIKLYNRHSQTVEHELVFEQRFMRTFYNTKPGLLLGELFIKRKWFSRLYGHFQKTAKSRHKIPGFITRYQINMDEAEQPATHYPTFNDFFIRRLKPDARPADQTPAHLVSPADARLRVFPIQEDLTIPIKGRMVALAALLAGHANPAMWQGGVCAVFRLAPSDYHRFCFIDSGTQSPITRVRGHFHSVSPFALQHNIPVFDGNYREICTLHTHHFGEVVHIDVGALVVGRIQQHMPDGGPMKRGMEKGYFEFGASTVILLFKPGTVQFDKDILNYAARHIETRVKMGEKIAVAL